MLRQTGGSGKDINTYYHSPTYRLFLSSTPYLFTAISWASSKTYKVFSFDCLKIIHTKKIDEQRTVGKKIQLEWFLLLKIILSFGLFRPIESDFKYIF